MHLNKMIRRRCARVGLLPYPMGPPGTTRNGDPWPAPGFPVKCESPSLSTTTRWPEPGQGHQDLLLTSLLDALLWKQSHTFNDLPRNSRNGLIDKQLSVRLEMRYWRTSLDFLTDHLYNLFWSKATDLLHILRDPRTFSEISSTRPRTRLSTFRSPNRSAVRACGNKTALGRGYEDPKDFPLCAAEVAPADSTT